MSSPLANTFGAIEIGSIFAIFLFGIITLQAYVYFTTFDEDHLAFRALVCIAFLFFPPPSLYSELDDLPRRFFPLKDRIDLVRPSS